MGIFSGPVRTRLEGTCGSPAHFRLHPVLQCDPPADDILLSKEYTKSENNLVESRHLAHWKYDADEWDRFTAHEWKTARNNAFWYPVGIVIVVAAFGYFFKGWGFEELKNVMPWIFALAVAIGLIILAIAQRSRKKSLQNVGETYIGEDAIQFNGKYYPWVGFGLKLGKVIFLKGDPSMLEFEIKRLTRYGYTPSEIRVPVPRAHQEEAERIVQKFSQQSANQESISSGSSRGKAK